MKTMKILKWKSAHLVVSAMMMSAASYAENAVKVTIEKINVEDTVYTPYYEVQTEQQHDQGSAQRWIRFGVYFTTEGGWIDEIDVTQIAVNNSDKPEHSVMLSEKVHYINIEPGEHHVYVYLHPSYVKRYEMDAFDIDIAAVIEINGQAVARLETSKKQETGWSQNTNEKMAKGYLLNHAETPFSFINYDFKEIIKHQ